MHALILALLLVSPAYSLRTGLSPRDAAPYGICNSPAGNTTWTNTDGFGLGEVYYEGVDEAITPPIGNMTWTTSFSIDISLVAVKNPDTPYYLAQGLVLSNSEGQNINVFFQVPTVSLGVGDTPVYYSLIIDELQERTTPGAPLGSKGKTAAPYIFLAGSSPAPETFSGSSGPCGTLQNPKNGMTWDNANEFETAHVTYQGIDGDYAGDNYSHVTTFTMDIYLRGADGSTFYLARGIAPSGTVADAQFEVPTSLPDATYDLVVDEYQKRLTSSDGTTATSLYMYTSAAVAPITLAALAVSSNPTMTASRGTNSGASSSVSPGISPTSASVPAQTSQVTSSGTPIGAVIGGALGGLAALSIAAGVISLWYRKRSQRSKGRQSLYEASPLPYGQRSQEERPPCDAPPLPHDQRTEEERPPYEAPPPSYHAPSSEVESVANAPPPVLPVTTPQKRSSPKGRRKR